MSYSCIRHGWAHLFNHCPSCTEFVVISDSSTSPSIMSDKKTVDELSLQVSPANRGIFKAGHASREDEVAEKDRRIAELKSEVSMWETRFDDSVDGLRTALEFKIGRLELALKVARETLGTIKTAVARDDEDETAHISNFHRLEDSNNRAIRALTKIREILDESGNKETKG